MNSALRIIATAVIPYVLLRELIAAGGADLEKIARSCRLDAIRVAEIHGAASEVSPRAPGSARRALTSVLLTHLMTLGIMPIAQFVDLANPVVDVLLMRRRKTSAFAPDCDGVALAFKATSPRARVVARPCRSQPQHVEMLIAGAAGVEATATIVATNLRRARRERGFSQESLAWEAGVNRSYVAKIETGKTRVGLGIVCKLPDAYGSLRSQQD